MMLQWNEQPNGERTCDAPGIGRYQASNQIMQIAERFGVLDLATLDPEGEAYESWAAVLAGHQAEASQSQYASTPMVNALADKMMTAKRNLSKK